MTKSGKSPFKGVQRPNPLEQHQDSGLPEVGRLGLGVRVYRPHPDPKKAEAGEMISFPKEVDYFVLSKPDPRNPNKKASSPTFIKKFESVYGSEPKELKVTFISPDITEIYDRAFRLYQGNRQIRCQSFDGKVAKRRNTKLGTWEEFECPKSFENGDGGPECECPIRWGKANKDGVQQDQCMDQLKFRAMLPDVSADGVVQISTSSSYGERALIQKLRHYVKIFGLEGMMHKPFILSRVETEIPFNGTMQKHWILNLEMAAELNEVVIEGYDEQQRFTLGRMRKEIAAPVENHQPLQISGPVIEDAHETEDTVEINQVITTAISLVEGCIRADIDRLVNDVGLDKPEAQDQTILAVLGWLKSNGIDVEGVTGTRSLVKPENAQKIFDLFKDISGNDFPWRKQIGVHSGFVDPSDDEIDSEFVGVNLDLEQNENEEGGE